MLPLEQAKELLNQHFVTTFSRPLETEHVPLWDASDRILAVDITAAEHIPGFDRSPVDGYALRSEDVRNAAIDSPISLTLVDTVAAGSYSDKTLTSGTAMTVFTGAPLPNGADCVIKKEDTQATEDHNIVLISQPVSRGENIAYKGEDIALGEFLFAKGTTLRAPHIGILASLGVDPVPVYQKPKIGIFSTGNELIDPQESLQHGQLRASNLFTIADLIRRAGGVPINLGLVKDRTDDVLDVYKQAQQMGLPFVISTGGTASGDFDVIKEAMEATGSERLFNKIAMRPGAPVVVSIAENQWLIGLSGNPAGSAVAMQLVICPLILKLAGTNPELADALPASVQASLTAPIMRKGGLRGFLWGRYTEQDGQIFVTPNENQFCGAVKTYANSNCLIEVPAGKVDFSSGQDVTIWKFF